MAALSVFIKEPTLDWLELVKSFFDLIQSFFLICPKLYSDAFSQLSTMYKWPLLFSEVRSRESSAKNK